MSTTTAPIAPGTTLPPRQLTEEEIEMLAKLVVAIVGGIVWSVEKASPHVRRWWAQRALPAAMRARQRVVSLVRRAGTMARRDRREPRSTLTPSVADAQVVVAASQVRMSSEEWVLRFRAMMAATAFRDEQLRVLSNARIEDQAVPEVEGNRAPQQLTAQEFAERLAVLLGANPSVLSEQAAEEWLRAIETGNDRQPEDGAVPLPQ